MRRLSRSLMLLGCVVALLFVALGSSQAAGPISLAAQDQGRLVVFESFMRST